MLTHLLLDKFVVKQDIPMRVSQGAERRQKELDLYTYIGGLI